MAFVAFAQFFFHESGDVLVRFEIFVAARKIFKQPLVAAHKARFQQIRANGHVGARVLDTFARRAHGVSGFHARVPQQIDKEKHAFALNFACVFINKKQYVNIRKRRKFPSAVSAASDDGGHGILFGIKQDGADEMRQNGKHFIRFVA